MSIYTILSFVFYLKTGIVLLTHKKIHRDNNGENMAESEEFAKYSGDEVEGIRGNSRERSSTEFQMTIVTAFMSNINQRGDRDIQKYVDLGYKLLDVNIRQIVFMERRVFDSYFRGRYMYLSSGLSSSSRLSFVYDGREYTYVVFGRITFVLFEKTDMYFCSVRDTITEFSLDTPHPAKDTLEYMFVQCHKTEWVAMAIQLDGGVSSRNMRSIPETESKEYKETPENDVTQVPLGVRRSLYVWMDFGIRHMFPSDISCEMELYQLRDRVLRSTQVLPSTQKVFAPGCWNPTCIYYQDVYRQIMWVFAGSMFGGNATILLEFARRTKEKCLSIIREKRRLMWEVNVWYLVWLDCREMFALYHGDHNATILRGCCSVVGT